MLDADRDVDGACDVVGYRGAAEGNDLSRYAGRHADHFAHDTPDAEWLSVIGQKGWIVITHDERIRYKANELAAVIQHRIPMLLVVGHAPYSQLAENFVRAIPRIEAFVAAHRPLTSRRSIAQRPKN